MRTRFYALRNRLVFRVRARRKRFSSSTLLIAILFAAAFPRQGLAIFGLGDIVFDPTTYVQVVEEVNQLIAQLQQLKETYALLKSELKMIGSRGAWVALAQKLKSSAIHDINGETVDLSAVVNGGGSANADAAWAKAVFQLNSSDFLKSETLGASAHLANAAGIEMTDAFAADGLGSVGDWRANQPEIVAAVQALQSAEQSLGDDDNTPVAQQNITNGALMQLIKLQLSTAAMHAAALEQLAAANTWHRNGEAESLNMYGRAAEVRATTAIDYGNTANTLKTYLIP